MKPEPHGSPLQPDPAAVVTKAVVKATELLDLPASQLSLIIGVSEATVSRMKNGSYILPEGSKAFELAVLFIRLYRSLDAIIGGEKAVARQWMVNQNSFLNAKPIDKIKTISGLFDVIGYLDARRARI